MKIEQNLILDMYRSFTLMQKNQKLVYKNNSKLAMVIIPRHPQRMGNMPCAGLLIHKVPE